ncbi:MAG: preprotein translocase subunit SecA [Blastocatellia bacterium]|nr:preprotein translocase subunit SecA [Blastocatellia bacterium]
MIDKLLARVFGSANERYLKRIRPYVAAINDFEPALQKLDDAQLRAQTVKFKEKLDNGATLDDLLPEAFATVREASRRTTGMRHFDVQMIGGTVLHQGRIAEMRTGEGKTLVATAPTYLNALTGNGVHVVTVNDYLARRDAEWMGKIHKFLGLSVGVIQSNIDDFERKEAYGCDVTYGTNNEFGFDYLRDNMKFSLEYCVQRGFNYAIVDEVDSILIDEARTPLIIAGPSEDSTEKYYTANDIIPRLDPKTDFLVDEKTHSATLTEEGIEHAEKLLGCGNLYDLPNRDILHCLSQALRAHTLYRRDKDYLVMEGQVHIIDEHTGRVMHGRRWSDGLHQAVEAKEGVKIERENQTLATVTLQNYFRMYSKLAGMTGTAETEAAEFAKIYNLDVTVIPTNRPMVRKDNPDMIYRTAEEKWEAVVEEIKELQEKGQPVLVGTASVENSELLSKMLKPLNIPHQVLNAKFHEKEAEIVAQAGRKGAITIATNMAGRGTDILLGGNPEFLAREFLKKQEINPDEATTEQFEAALAQAKEIVAKEHEEVVALGGLHILGTERHESRRIDNQLRGRAGRQGDPGSSRFYLSLEDDLMRIFGGERVKNLMLTLGMEHGVAIESRMVSKRVEGAQKSVEAHNFSIRKHLLEYDDVMNKQREIIYGLRREMIEEGEGGRKFIDVAEDLLEDLFEEFAGPQMHAEDWNLEGLKVKLMDLYGVNLDEVGLDLDTMSSAEIRAAVWKTIRDGYDEKEKAIGPERLRELERYIMLNVVDAQWKDHLLTIDHLKDGIGLEAYGQKDPLQQYKRRSRDLFEQMVDRVDQESVRLMFNMKIEVAEHAVESIESEEEEESLPPAQPAALPANRPMPRPVRNQAQLTYTKANAGAARAGEAETAAAKPQPLIKAAKVGRNDACPCGSGKKYKNCHGK